MGALTRTFLKRFKSLQLDKILNFIDGKLVSAKFSGMKKGDMVAWINALFNNEVDRDNLPPEAKDPIVS